MITLFRSFLSILVGWSSTAEGDWTNRRHLGKLVQPLAYKQQATPLQRAPAHYCRMVALLVELWERIARLCRREDLLTLSLVSPTLRDIARRTLAEDITFDGSREHLDYLGVLKFLRDQNLATCVKRFGCLRMSICNLRTPGAIIPFEDMTNLQSLSFTRYSLLCMTAQDQKTFVDAVRRCCPQLVELKIQYNGPPFDEYFAIPNLQKITWDEDG